MKLTCRDLLIFASLIGLLHTQACATQSPAPSRTPAARRSPIGTGLDPLTSWNAELPFLDIFKTSGSWMSGTADVWDDHRTLDLDEHGWVRSLRPGQRAMTLMMFGSQLWVNSAYRGQMGRYTVLYDGEGTLEYYGARVVESQPGRDVIDLQPEPNDGLGLIITSVNPRNYLRNIRVLMPGATAGETFNPRFLEGLRGYSVIRFLAWMVGPSVEDYAVTPHTWATRPTPEEARWESISRGAPVEIMVSLSNRVHANPWFNIPHLADDDFVRRFAETVRASLDPGLKVYVEHSNEVWNASYRSQYDYAAQRGLALGFSSDPDQARQRYHALRTRQIGAIFREVLGRNRVVVVLATQDSVASISEEMLSWNGTAADVDALATAPYFGYELGLKENEPRVARMSLDDLFRELETDLIPIMNSGTEQQAAVARKYNLPLISYEGGQHLANLEGGAIARVEALFDAANRDPRMGRIYSKYLEDWNRITGGGLWVHLMSCGEAGRGGRWGAVEYLGQPRSEAPKYDAIQKWLEQGAAPQASTGSQR
jgi:hypothetical protein